MSDHTPLSPLRQAIRDLILVVIARHPSSNRQEFADSMGEFSARTWRRALAQRDEPKQRPPRLEDLLELLSEALDVEVVHLVMAIARLIEERAKEDDVSRARHHGSLALEAANASNLHFVVLEREDATVLIEGAPEVKALVDAFRRLRDEVE